MALSKKKKIVNFREVNSKNAFMFYLFFNLLIVVTAHDNLIIK